MQEFLHRHRYIALDTCLFIYQVEANPRYTPFTDEIFQWLQQGNGMEITSTLTMTELLVQPYREQDGRRVDQYYGLLSTFPSLEWKHLTLETADLAAHFRAHYNLRTPDAIQAATAVEGKATGFLTNDFSFERVYVFETLVLDTLFQGGGPILF